MSGSVRVLLVDDDGGRAAVRQLLMATTIGDAIEFVEAAPASNGAATDVDCVLLGHHPPDADARVVLQALRDGGMRTPVIVFTAEGDEPLAVELMKAGASDYLVKGKVTGEQLAQSVRNAVRVHRAEAMSAAAQERLHEATRAKDEAVALLDTLLGSAPVGIAVFDRELRYVRVNHELARINGLSVEAHLGRTLTDLLPKMNPQVAEDLRGVLQSGVPIVNIDVSGETPADPGATHDWMVSYYPVRAPTGETLGVGTTIIDITDRKRHQRELAQAKEAAEAANRSKDQFLAVLSHELRTPLTPVLMAVQAMQEGDAPEELRGMLAMIRRNVELEARLIDDLLDLTRIAKGKLQLHLEMIDAHDLLTSALEICRSEIDAKSLKVEFELTARRHCVYADSARLQQVFWNLINNAIKFTSAGGTITLRTFDEDERLVAQVIDSGIGIDADTLPRIFDAFEQGEGTITRRFGGLGLGLAICRALVRMHWGQITAWSAGKGTGSAFTVKLGGHVPATVLRGTGAPSVKSTSPQLKPPAGDRSRSRILMVDDHEDTRAAMKKLLERSGYHVTTADSVQAAIQSAGDEPIDILISDIGLPDGSGLEIMRHLRERRNCYPVRGIALSGFGMEEDVRKSREAGFDHHLTKPVTFDRLRAVLKQIEGGKRET
jgi:PAS domain S-box-containing protein